MNNDRICDICKHHGQVNWGKYKDIIFQSDREHTVYLCYFHSVDLFKVGQTNFLAKYQHIPAVEAIADTGSRSSRKRNFLFSGFK